MINNQQPKKSRVAVVSGGTGYVGSAIVKRLSADGLNVAMLYHSASEEEIDSLLKALPGNGHRAYKCRLEDASAVEKVIEKIEGEQGPIYACIHTAATLPPPKQLHLSSRDDLEGYFNLNVFGAFNFISTCALRLKQHEAGVIAGITTAGVVSQLNTRARGIYSSSKFALQGMLVALKEELAPHHVRVYSIAPGVMPGGLNRDTPQAFLDMVKEKSPTKALAEAKDIASVVSFLCSDDSSHLTNLTLVVAPESGMI